MAFKYNKMKKNKILIITPGFFPLFGGMEEQCYLLAQSFIKKGIAVDVLTEKTQATFEESESIDGINVFRMRHVQKRNFGGFISLAFDLARFLIKNSGEYDFCIIRTLTYHALVVGVLKFFKIVLMKSFVTAETGGEKDDVISLKDMKFHNVIIFFLRQHDFLNSICLDNYKHYQELCFDEKKLTRLYNGVDVSRYDGNKYPESLNNFIFLGRLSATKGIYELLNAFKKVVEMYPKKKLFIGGDGNEKQGVIEFIAQNNLGDNIIYEGYVSKDQKDDFYKKGDCLILPSYSEGFPISILEATVCKKKIIVTDVSDLREIYGEQLVFCKKRDENDLFEQIISASEKHHNSMMNYDAVIGKIDIDNITKQLLEILG